MKARSVQAKTNNYKLFLTIHTLIGHGDTTAHRNWCQTNHLFILLHALFLFTTTAHFSQIKNSIAFESSSNFAQQAYIWLVASLLLLHLSSLKRLPSIFFFEPVKYMLAYTGSQPIWVARTHVSINRHTTCLWDAFTHTHRHARFCFAHLKKLITNKKCY